MFGFLYLQMQLDAIKLIELNKLTWKSNSAFHPVCSNIIAATLWQIHCITFLRKNHIN